MASFARNTLPSERSGASQPVKVAAMPILRLAAQPPDADAFRSMPVHQWGLSDTSPPGATFASIVFSAEDTNAALQVLSSTLFAAKNVRPRPPQPPTQPATKPQMQPQMQQLRGVGGGGDADASLASDDDLDFHYVKKPPPKASSSTASRPENRGSTGAGGAALRTVGREHDAPRDFPMNHFEKVAHEKMLQEQQRQQTVSDEADDPWCRTLLPRERDKGKMGGAPFFGAAGSAAGGGDREKGGGKKEREPNRCSICQQPGHSKRTCALAGRNDAAERIAGGGGTVGGDGERQKRSKSKKQECEAPVQSFQDKLDGMSGVTTNAGMLDGPVALDELLRRVGTCSCIVFGLLFSNNDSNLRDSRRKGNIAREPLGCCLLLTDLMGSDDERAANVFVPFVQAAGFTTTLDQRRSFLQRVFSQETACPLVCFNARSCLLAMSPFLQLQPLPFSQAPVCCVNVAQWLLDPDIDPAVIGFDQLVERLLLISPFSAEAVRSGCGGETEEGQGGVGGKREKASKDLSAESGLVRNHVDASFCRVLFQDMSLCAQMWELLAQRLQHSSMEGAASLEMSCIPVLCMMEEVGIGFSPTRLIKERKAMESKLIQLEEEATKLLGHPVLLTSPQQLCSVLFEELRLPPPTNSGLRASTASASTSKFQGAHQQYSTNEEVLSALVDLHPLPAIVLEHRHITKMLTGFVVPLCERAIRAAERDGLSSIHTCWSQTSTATGRLSSSEPNLQNVPKQESVRFGTRTDLTKDMNVRTAFVPRANKILLSIDYVQCELRIMAHFSQDASLIGLLNGTECPYSGIAASVQRKHVSEVTPRERNIYKTVVLGMLYGQGQKSLATKLNMTESEAANTISRFFNCFPAVREFKARTIRSAKELGYVSTLSGRRRTFADLLLTGAGQDGFKRAYAERQAVNFVIQGSAADYIKMAMKGIMEELCAKGLADQCCCCLQIHDELVFEIVPSVLTECATLIAKCMTECLQLRVPMRVKAQVGRTWGELVPLDSVTSETLSPHPAPAPAGKNSGHAISPSGSNSLLPGDGEGALAENGEEQKSLSSANVLVNCHGVSNDANAVGSHHDLREGVPSGCEDGGDVSGRLEVSVGDGDGGRTKKRRDPVEMLFDFDSFRKRAAPQRHAPSPGVSCSPATKTGQDAAAPLSPQKPPTVPAHQSNADQEPLSRPQEEAVPTPQTSQRTMPLQEIMMSGINLNPFRSNRLVGRPASKFAPSQPSLSALHDDDTDQLDLL